MNTTLVITAASFGIMVCLKFLTELKSNEEEQIVEGNVVNLSFQTTNDIYTEKDCNEHAVASAA